MAEAWFPPEHFQTQKRVMVPVGVLRLLAVKVPDDASYLETDDDPDHDPESVHIGIGWRRGEASLARDALALALNQTQAPGK